MNFGLHASWKDGIAHDKTTEDAVLEIFEDHMLQASVLEPALRDDRHFGNIIGKWRVGSLIISIVSDRGQWFAELWSPDTPENKVDIYDIAASLKRGLPDDRPPESVEALAQLIASSFAAIEALTGARVRSRMRHK